MAVERPPIALRPATAADRAFVESLSREAFGRFGPYDRILVYALGRPAVRTVVAEARGVPVGFAMTEPADEEIYLVAIAVAPEWRRRGVGRRLLREAEAQAARETPAERTAAVALTVAQDNGPARALFASEGYRDVPSRSDPYPAGQPSLRMRKTVVATD